MASAIRLRTADRSASEVSAQASFAWWAASRASSTSSGVDFATSQKGLPSTGLTLTMYCPNRSNPGSSDEVVVAGLYLDHAAGATWRNECVARWHDLGRNHFFFG